MIIVNNLSVNKKDGTELLKDLSFTLDIEDKIAVIGEEGNGKSTLLKIITKDEDTLKNFDIKGTVKIINENIAYLPQRLPDKWLNETPMDYLLKKEPESSIKPEDYNNLGSLEELIRIHSLKKDLIREDVLLNNLSGGEKVMLQLLKILHNGFTALLLDEPTNDLDVDTLEYLNDFIINLKKPLLFVSHDELLLENTANQIIHLEQLNLKTKRRAVVFKGSYREYVETRLKGHEKALKLSKKEKAEYFKKKEKLNDIMNAVHHAQKNISRSMPGVGAALKKKMGSLKSMEKRFEKEGYSTVDHLEESIDVYFNDIKLPSTKVIIDSSFKVEINGETLIQEFPLKIVGNEKVVIKGPNGSGKTLLIKQIYEELKDRDDLTIGYMPQNYMHALDGYSNPIEFLSQGEKEENERARELLGAMKFTREEMIKSPTSLSEGQKAKILILSFIINSPEVLILDEPTRNFSPLSAPVIRDILKQYKGSIICVSHDRLLINSLPDRILEVKDKKVSE